MTSFAKFEIEVSARQLMYVLLESINTSYYLAATHRRSKERHRGPLVHTNVGKYATTCIDL